LWTFLWGLSQGSPARRRKEKMKKYTIEDVKSFEVVNGTRKCPTGDYTEIKNFAEFESCSFDESCSFGKSCSFGESCSYEELGEAKTRIPFIRINNIGSRGDGCTIYNLKKGIYVRTGCFLGTIKEFQAAVKERHGSSKYAKQYILAVKLAKVSFAE